MRDKKILLDVNSKLNYHISPWISSNCKMSDAIKYLEKKLKIDFGICGGHTISTKSDGIYTWWTGGFKTKEPITISELFNFINGFSKYGYIEHYSVWLKE